MRYMLLLYVPNEDRDVPGQRAGMDAWHQYTRDLQESGALLGGDALQDLRTATTVRVREGETLVADGPFAETKEMLGGFYMIDVPDLDTALSWAARVPNAPYGSVEVRPIMEIPAPVEA